MSNKLYFSNDIPEEENFVRCKQGWLKIIKSKGFESIILIEAVRDKSDVFFCKHFYECFEKTGIYGDRTCGSNCHAYKPRNGKSGYCQFSRPCYEEGNRKYRLSIDGKLKLIRTKV